MVILSCFTQILDYRRLATGKRRKSAETIEQSAIEAFLQFCLRTSELLFKPAFLRCLDWALALPRSELKYNDY